MGGLGTPCVASEFDTNSPPAPGATHGARNWRLQRSRPRSAYVTGVAAAAEAGAVRGARGSVPQMI